MFCGFYILSCIQKKIPYPIIINVSIPKPNIFEIYLNIRTIYINLSITMEPDRDKTTVVVPKYVRDMLKTLRQYHSEPLWVVVKRLAENTIEKVE